MISNVRRAFFLFATLSLTSAMSQLFAEEVGGIPDLTGKSIETARSVLSDQFGGEIPFEVQEIDSIKRIGTIIRHWPSEGGTVGSGGLLLQVSAGYVIPSDVFSKGLYEAEQRLKADGVLVRRRIRRPTDLHKPENDQMVPPPGSRIDASERFVVLIDWETVTVPASSNKSVYTDLGLVPIVTDRRRRNPRSNDPCTNLHYRTVLSITPKPGSEVAVGATVNITITSGELVSAYSDGPDCDREPL